MNKTEIIFGNYVDREFMQRRYDLADESYKRAKLHRNDLVKKGELGDNLETCCKAIDFYLTMKLEAKEYLK